MWYYLNWGSVHGGPFYIIKLAKCHKIKCMILQSWVCKTKHERRLSTNTTLGNFFFAHLILRLLKSLSSLKSGLQRPSLPGKCSLGKHGWLCLAERIFEFLMHTIHSGEKTRALAAWCMLSGFHQMISKATAASASWDYTWVHTCPHLPSKNVPQALPWSTAV